MTPARTPAASAALDGLMAREQERFAATHAASLECADRAGRSLLGGVPMNWMRRWPGAFPVFAREASGATVVDVDGNTYDDLCLGDTGAMSGHSPVPTARAIEARAAHGLTMMLPTEDAVWVGEELARRFGLPIWQIALDGHRCEPLRAPDRPGGDRPARHRVLRLVLPRVGRRDAGRPDGRADSRAAGQRRAAGASGDHDARGRVERRRRPAGRARPGRRGGGDRRARAHQHRDRPSGGGFPRRAAGHHARPRHAPGDRRDPHDLRRTGWCDRGLGTGAGSPDDREVHRRGDPGRGLRHDERRRRPGRARGDRVPPGRRERHRGDPLGQRAPHWRRSARPWARC